MQTAAARRRLRLTAFVVALLTSVLVIAFLSLDVVRKINQQSVASTDNVQWSVAQINVEYLQLLLTVRSAIDGEDSLEEVRRRFDVFYSRMITMQRSPVFSVLREDKSFAESYAKIWAFLNTNVALIDGDDADLARGLPKLADQVQALRPDASVMGLTGIRVFARRTDAVRSGIARTLLQVSILTLGLIIGMGVLAATLARMNAAIKRQARENQAQGERVKAVFATSLDAVIVADAAGRVLEFNAAAEAMFGYSAADVVGKDMGPLIVPPHLREAHARGMASFRANGAHKMVGKGHVRMEAMRNGGQVFPIELSLSVSQEDQSPIFISYLRDLSAQVAAEQELLRARDDALAGEKAKAELLAVMSHEMRTPLNGMLGTMELLRQTRLTAKQQQYHRIMESSGKLLLHHVNDVLDIVRVDSGKAVITKRRVNIANLIHDIIEGQSAVAMTGFNDLRAYLPEDGRTEIDCDPVRLRQVLLNLVGNALKFTRNGEVRIEVERMDEAGLIEFRVCDTGIGIHDEDRDRIFEDFVTLDASYSRSVSGTGLGLGIVRRWVKAMDGELGVESEVGEGSLFWVRLPLETPATRPAVATDEPETDSAPAIKPDRQLSVLVVEDNPVNRLVVREMLQLDGHSVMEANDGEEGVQMAAVRRWDAILMDVSMPQKDGVEATLEIRRSNGASANSPIVALTAHALPSETERFMAAGMQMVMTKPVSREALRRALRQVTGQVSASSASAETASDVEAEPFVDAARLAELRETLGPKALQNTLQSFFTEVEPLVSYWRGLELLADRDVTRLESLKRDVHRVSGSAAIFGAVRFRARLVEVESACKTGNPEMAAAGLHYAVAVWPETRAALELAAKGT